MPGSVCHSLMVQFCVRYHKKPGITVDPHRIFGIVKPYKIFTARKTGLPDQCPVNHHAAKGGYVAGKGLSPGLSCIAVFRAVLQPQSRPRYIPAVKCVYSACRQHSTCKSLEIRVFQSGPHDFFHVIVFQNRVVIDHQDTVHALRRCQLYPLFKSPCAAQILCTRNHPITYILLFVIPQILLCTVRGGIVHHNDFLCRNCLIFNLLQTFLQKFQSVVCHHNDRVIGFHNLVSHTAFRCFFEMCTFA